MEATARAGGASSAVVRSRVAALDGLRGLALVAVLVYHASASALTGGFLGVEVFFVLSGYLLTALLLAEQARTGRIDTTGFLVRRLRRLGPALAVLLAGLVVVAPVVAPDDVRRLPGDVISSALGLTNWRLIQDGSSYFGQLGRPSLLRHLWSLAVEIQFYVLFPFLVAWLARRKKDIAIATLVVAIGLSADIMAELFRSPDPSRAYFGTDARVGAMLTGVLLAFCLAPRHPAAEPRRAVVFVRRGVYAVPGLLGLASLAVLFVTADEQGRILYPAGFLTTQAATVLVIASVMRPGWTASLLGCNPLPWLGRRCYGIYLWHWPLVSVLRPGLDVDWPAPVAQAVALAGALVLGDLSYRFVELPLMHRRPVDARTTRPTLVALRFSTGAVAVGAVAVLLAQLPTRDPLEESLKAGQRVLASQASAPTTTSRPAPTTVAPAPETTVAPAPVADLVAQPRVSAPGPAVAREPVPRPPRPAPAPGPPPGSIAVTAIGDSVMVGGSRALQPRLGGSGYIDAKLSRQWYEGIALLRQLRAEGRMADVVVIHLGNNGPIRGGEMDAMMRELEGIPHVLLVTVRVNKSWQNGVNQTLHDAAARYPTVQLVDWNGYSEGQRDWFQSDGTHLKGTAGPNAYADLVVGSIPPPPPPSPPPDTTTTTAPPDTTTTTTPVAPPP